MRIRCPSCSSAYDVADALLDPPRIVRCARCAHDWMAEPAQDEASSAHPAETGLPIADPGIEAVPTAAGTAEETPSSAIQRLSAPIDPPPPRPPAPRQDRWLTAAWAASFAVLAGLGAAGYTQRDLMMRKWPASQMVYAKLGLTPVAPGSEQPPAH